MKGLIIAIIFVSSGSVAGVRKIITAITSSRLARITRV
jgi:hypothetical protein